MSKSPREEKGKDLALLQGPTEDGEGARILRFRDGNISAGELRPLKDGQPIHSQELLRLRPVEGAPALCEVEVMHDLKPSRSHGGPARVANAAYRRNWQNVFARKDADDEGEQNALGATEHDTAPVPRTNRPRPAADKDWSLN